MYKIHRSLDRIVHTFAMDTKLATVSIVSSSGVNSTLCSRSGFGESGGAPVPDVAVIVDDDQGANGEVVYSPYGERSYRQDTYPNLYAVISTSYESFEKGECKVRLAFAAKPKGYDDEDQLLAVSLGALPGSLYWIGTGSNLHSLHALCVGRDRETQNICDIRYLLEEDNVSEDYIPLLKTIVASTISALVEHVKDRKAQNARTSVVPMMSNWMPASAMMRVAIRMKTCAQILFPDNFHGTQSNKMRKALKNLTKRQFYTPQLGFFWPQV